MNKIIFLDRDGILNEETGDYVFSLETFKINGGVPEALKLLKDHCFKLVVVTNQGGIGKGIYTREQMRECHAYLQRECDNAIDHIYYAVGADVLGKSLMRKPDSLMLERGLAKYKAQPEDCWLVGDAERDLKAAHKLGVKSILVPTLKEQHSPFATAVMPDLLAAARFIVGQ